MAALLHRLPREALRRLRLLVRPDTIVRWHRDLIARRHGARSKPKRPGRPPTVRSIRALVLRLVTLSGAHMYLAVIEHASRRVRILGATAHPTTSWVVQAAKNLVIDLQDAGYRARFMIRDRDGKYPQLFDAVLRDTGIEVVFSGIRMPRMNSITERWVETCRHELLDRTLIWNQHHLLHALREFERFYNEHRPPRASPAPDHSIHYPRRSSTWTRSPS